MHADFYMQEKVATRIAIQTRCLKPLQISRRRAAKINLILGYGRYTVGIFNQLVLVPLYLRFIGIAVYGSWLASGNVVALLSVLDIGFNLIVTQRLATAFGAGDDNRFVREVGSSLGLFWLPLFSSAQSCSSCRHGFPDGLTHPQARLRHCVEPSC